MTLKMSLETGGLQWVDLVCFDKSLKITWIRKLLNGAAEWTEFARFHKIDRLIWSAEKYHQQIIDNFHNLFWKSVAKAYKGWFKILLQTPNYPHRFPTYLGQYSDKHPF